VVFKLAPGGTETVLYSFKGGSDGAFPAAGLLADSSGNLYGTASQAGGSGNGVVFKLAPGGGTETVLYSFCSLPSCSDGSTPFAGLIADTSGNLYGTTTSGGASGNGVVFKLAPGGGTETVLYSFCSLPSCSDGAIPFNGSLIADSSGNLYGTTLRGGGAARVGVVFELTGTGFVTAVPFLAFSAQLQLDIDAKPTKDAFALESSFTLSSTAPPINPLTQAVALQVGPFSATLPPGSFKQTGPLFTFAGVISGVNVQALIAPTGTLRYAFAAAAEHPNLTGTKNPVPVTLTIGNDSGTKSVNAIIFH
jgi:uncharacterized repeat protein (TIGR03803 family)